MIKKNITKKSRRKPGTKTTPARARSTSRTQRKTVRLPSRSRSKSRQREPRNNDHKASKAINGRLHVEQTGNRYHSVMAGPTKPVVLGTEMSGSVDIPINAFPTAAQAFASAWQQFELKIGFHVNGGLGRGCMGRIVAAYLPDADVSKVYSFAEISAREYAQTAHMGDIDEKRRVSLSVSHRILVGGDVFIVQDPMVSMPSYGVIRVQWDGILSAFGNLPIGSTIWYSTIETTLLGFQRQVPSVAKRIRSGLKPGTNPDGTVHAWAASPNSLLASEDGSAGVFFAVTTVNPTGDPTNSLPANVLVATQPLPGHVHATISSEVTFWGPVSGMLPNDTTQLVWGYDGTGRFDGLETGGSVDTKAYQSNFDGTPNPIGAYYTIATRIHLVVSWVEAIIGTISSWITKITAAQTALGVVARAARGVAFAMGLRRSDGSQYPLPQPGSTGTANVLVRSSASVHHKATTGDNVMQFPEGNRALYPLRAPPTFSTDQSKMVNASIGPIYTTAIAYDSAVSGPIVAPPPSPPAPPTPTWDETFTIRARFKWSFTLAQGSNVQPSHVSLINTNLASPLVLNISMPFAPAGYFQIELRRPGNPTPVPFRLPSSTYLVINDDTSNVVPGDGMLGNYAVAVGTADNEYALVGFTAPQPKRFLSNNSNWIGGSLTQLMGGPPAISPLTAYDWFSLNMLGLRFPTVNSTQAAEPHSVVIELLFTASFDNEPPGLGRYVHRSLKSRGSVAPPGHVTFNHVAPRPIPAALTSSVSADLALTEYQQSQTCKEPESDFEDVNAVPQVDIEQVTKLLDQLSAVQLDQEHVSTIQSIRSMFNI